MVSIVALALWFFVLQKGESLSPDFLVSDPSVEIRFEPFNQLLFSFTLENNGTSVATNVVGNVGFQTSGGGWTTRNWAFPKAANVIEVDEEISGCYAVFFDYDYIPADEFVITVSCDEGTSREFNVSLP